MNQRRPDYRQTPLAQKSFDALTVSSLSASDGRDTTADDQTAALNRSTAKSERLPRLTIQMPHSLASPMSPQLRIQQAGFSLLEVLIAIMVLCFGVLGMVGLQAASLQANREARLQSSATRLAEELAEMMRGNKSIAVQLTNNPYLITSTTVTNPGCGYPGTSACTTLNAIAQRDVYEWLERVKVELPDPKVTVCQDSTPYDTSGLPQWVCSESGGTIVLKMGWTRSNTLRSATGTDATDTSGANTGAFDKALRPAVTFSLTPGSAT